MVAGGEAKDCSDEQEDELCVFDDAVFVAPMLRGAADDEEAEGDEEQGGPGGGAYCEIRLYGVHAIAVSLPGIITDICRAAKPEVAVWLYLTFTAEAGEKRGAQSL